MMPTPDSSLRAIVAGSPILSTILNRWSSIDLPDCWLSGSAIAQTAWNAAFGLSPDYGLADIDLVYFDVADLSEEGEARQAASIRALFPDVPLWIDAKNEARVHLWYEAKFGYPMSPTDRPNRSYRPSRRRRGRLRFALTGGGCRSSPPSAYLTY